MWQKWLFFLNVVQESAVRLLQSCEPQNIPFLSFFIFSLLQLAYLQPPSYLRILQIWFKTGVNFSMIRLPVLHESPTASMKDSLWSPSTVLSFHRLLSVLPASLRNFDYMPNVEMKIRTAFPRSLEIILDTCLCQTDRLWHSSSLFGNKGKSFRQTVFSWSPSISYF